MRKATSPKINADQRAMLRYASKYHKRSIVTHLRHVAADHKRTADTAESPLLRRIAAKLHAHIEIAIDRLEDGDYAPLFRSPLQWQPTLTAARLAIRRAYK